MTSSIDAARRLMSNQNLNEIQTKQNGKTPIANQQIMSNLPHKDIMNQDPSIKSKNANEQNQYYNPNSTNQQDRLSSSVEEYQVGPGMKSSNFFQFGGIPKFGKNWLDNFIPDEEMQNTFMTSEIVRNVLMLECMYFASIFNELFLYKHTFNKDSPDQHGQNMVSVSDLPNADAPKFRLGIIGCGQIGTSFLTKLLEVQDQFHNLEIWVSTRQPHLLRPFKQEFGINIMFDNARVAAVCDIIFVCCLPNHLQEVFKDMREVIKDRSQNSLNDPKLINPLVVVTCAGTSYTKLRLMLKQGLIHKTSINVNLLKEYLIQAQAIHRIKQEHPEDTHSQSSGATPINKPDTADSKVRYMNRILSKNAIALGEQYGITPEFICQQTADQLAEKTDDLIQLFDILQASLYPSDYERMVAQQAADKINSLETTAKQVKDDISEVQSQRFSYEESILVAILGEQYSQFISEDGNWIEGDRVITMFQDLFLQRMRYLFEADTLEK